MKVGLKTIFFVGDDGGFGEAISGALHPRPDSSVQKLEESFEISLGQYGVRDRKVAGRIVHYVDDDGIYQVSVVHLQNYKMPVLACVLSEVLQQMRSEKPSAESTFVFPFLAPLSKLKRDTKSIKVEDERSSLYGVLLGPETGVSEALAAKTQKPPLMLQINHEPLARVLHIARVLNIASFILMGKEGQKQDLELIKEIGELLVSDSCLSYSRDKLVWDSARISREHNEPWRALYG